jgi:hypothetical protein
MRRAARLGAAVSVAFAGLSMLSAAQAMALPPVPQPGRVGLVEAVKRCPPGYRKSTITAKCVRIQPRWPSLSWIF